jgi:hypothetical protein
MQVESSSLPSIVSCFIACLWLNPWSSCTGTIITHHQLMIHNSKFLNTSIIVLNGMKELGKVRSCLDLFLVFKRAQFVHGQSAMLAFAIGHHSMLYLLEDTIELLWQLADRQLSHLNIYYRINVHFTPFKFSPSPNNP